AEKAAAEKAAAEKAAQRKAAEARRQAAVNALLSQAGDPDSTVQHGSPTGARDAGYAARVSSAIRANTTFTQTIRGNPQAVFQVRLDRQGKVLDVRLLRSSGNAAWDNAAERAIERTNPFPCPKTGSCQSTLEIHHGPQD
ncbi:MAG: cell envelope integrity protein TolA, partial [Lautropia sp.]|nr:cell envelope integrity protein TolA [Lautropia sp.]